MEIPANIETYQTINYLLHLRKQIRQTPSKLPRTLCLLVVYNAPLISAWEKTLNNDAINKSQRHYERQVGEDASAQKMIEVLEAEKCWKEGAGLSLWNVCTKGQPTLQSSGTFGVDIVLITAATLTRSTGEWVLQSKWHTVVADEAHDFLRGQHNAKNDLSNTLKLWYKLQPRTTSMFLLSGSPFMTKVTHDFVALTKAIATNEKREKWSPDCSDEGLDNLTRGWIGMEERKYQLEEKEQRDIRSKMTETLALYTLRRDETSSIRGQKVMVDYFAQCFDNKTALVPSDDGKELREREELYARFKGNELAKRLTQQRNDDMRCLCFSQRFLQWQRCRSPRQRAQVWDSYTLEEGRNYIRTRALIEYLREKKQKGDGVIVYAQRCFQAELAMKVFSGSTDLINN